MIREEKNTAIQLHKECYLGELFMKVINWDSVFRGRYLYSSRKRN